MKLTEFLKKMPKAVFSWHEASRVAWTTSAGVLRLDLHNWVKRGELVRLKRGLYMVPNRNASKVDIARALYSPAYLSLEWALHHHGFLPDVVFTLTLVSNRGTRHFKTPLGEFMYHKIKSSLFFGYDSDTLLAEPEKALVDIFYIRGGSFVPKNSFWNEMRWQNLDKLDFTKAKKYAKASGVAKVIQLVESLHRYAKT